MTAASLFRLLQTSVQDAAANTDDNDDLTTGEIGADIGQITGQAQAQSSQVGCSLQCHYTFVLYCIVTTQLEATSNVGIIPCRSFGT